MMLDYGFQKLGADYEVVTARGSLEALQLIEQQPFDLVVTDYMMKGMTGVDLARAARRIAPDTQVVLISAYGNKSLEATSKSLGFEGYLDKPFEVPKLRRIVRNILGDDAEKTTSAPSPASEKVSADIRRHLQSLQVSVSARCILLLSSEGHPIEVIGQIEGLRISNISGIIAANFMGTTELAHLLGNSSIFRSSFHVGDDYNLYVYDVNAAFLLAVVFDAKRKPGVVWFYTKQAAIAIQPLLKPPSDA